MGINWNLSMKVGQQKSPLLWRMSMPCHMSSQGHKAQALTGRQPNTQKNQICLLFPFLYFSHFISFLSFSYIPIILFSTLRTMLCFKCGGIGKMLIFLFWLYLFFPKREERKKKKNLWLIVLNSYWFLRIWVLCMRIKWDRWIYKSNEWVCMQVLMFNRVRDWLWKYIMLTL